MSGRAASWTGRRNNREGDRRFRLSSHSFRSVVIGLCFLAASSSSHVLAEDAQAPRRIAPQTFPEYRGREAPEAEISVTLPTAARPLGGCEESLPRAVWLRCLRQTIDASDLAIEELVERARDRVAERSSVSVGQRQFWTRTLSEAQTAWKAHRTAECQFLAVFENPGPRSSDERLLCQLRFNRARLDDLKSRYDLR